MLRKLIGGLVDILYPKICLGCKNKLKEGEPSGYVCSGCLSKAQRNLPPFCCSCGRRLPKGSLSKNICPGCLRQKTHFDRAFCPYVYDGLIKELIHALKYKGKDYLGPFLGKLMADFIREYDLPMDDLDFIVPMPLHKTRLREREFNQAELLGGYIAREFNKELLTDVLKRHRYTKTQTELDTPNRLLNVKGSFSISGGDAIKGKNILLVDDVLTTGATASEATGALKSAGSGIVFVLTLAN